MQQQPTASIANRTRSRLARKRHARPDPVFWMRQRSSLEFDQQVAQVARTLDARLRRTLPAQWGPALDLVLPQRPTATAVGRALLGTDIHGWNLERVQALREFEHAHADVLHWSVGDSTLRDRAKRCAETVDDLLNGHAFAMTLQERLDVVLNYCDRLGVDYPPGKTAEGVIARACCTRHWTRALRKKAARESELAAIKLGVVNHKNGGYASDSAVKRRIEQNRRNTDMLKRSKIVNEAGQVYSLHELAALSVSNRDIRRGELMMRLRGCEEVAAEQGDYGVFLTLTCPSRFHAVLASDKQRGGRPVRNKNYRDTSPRDAQNWLNSMWQKARAKLGRKGIKPYGFRMAEPHHDGCPHWHAILWFKTPADARAANLVVRDYWLSDAGTEPGAQQHRVKFEHIDPDKGGAAAYVAKYITKNIGTEEAGGDAGLGDHADQLDGVNRVMAEGEYRGWQRVDAWASTWGIRQFQPVGQPSVTVWREMRRVSKDQIEQAQHRLDFGDDAVVKAWWACHKLGTLQASWRGYVHAQGGMCRKREQWKLRPAMRVENDAVNGYGEVFDRKTVRGVETAVGYWLVSRRQAWKSVASCDGEAAQDKAERAALGRPWTRFNNCTARLGREDLRQLLRGDKPWDTASDTLEILPLTPPEAAKPPPQPARPADPAPVIDAQGIRTTFRMPRHAQSAPAQPIAQPAPDAAALAALSARLHAAAAIAKTLRPQA